MKAALKALQAYNVKGVISGIAPFGLGHINDSYLVETVDQKLLLQKLNRSVFKSPEKIESNLQALLQAASALFTKHYKTAEGLYHTEADGSFWRLMDFIEDSYAPETANGLIEVEKVAEGFGRFTAFSNTLRPENFKEAIPQFHSLSWRLEQLGEAIEKDIAGRLESCQDLVKKANSFRWIDAKMDDLISKGLPLRVCHNDTKLNNCLLSQSDHSFRYIIDLDTLGPGYLLYDFGDLMRTTLSPTEENEHDENLIEIRKDYLDVLLIGFSKESGSVLTDIEIQSLTFGGLYMTYIMAIRFLADFLNGDTYYKTSFEEENFIRARNQLRLLELMNEL
ncbi:phosphotransferase enzyme family protein [Roseivirga sp. E12]|uniref:phosphotransferase enzyme family protein n=1 Tax=Roseivirga sp. E12 TaxID=2819237 RepID=UPI001ABC7F28|nr:aminoglycoside phosphotransferase family protein [Roseivirga sp. E12]MBO3699675.1 aminoglycoside phosphotransferase family protein [Roseivirga sp. E12]